MRLMRLAVTCVSRRRDGTSAVEVALTLPIFGVLLAGLMEFTHFYMVVHMLNAAARQGAHLGSYQGVTNAQVTTTVQRVVSAAFNTPKATVIVRDASAFDAANVNPKTLNYNALPAVDLTKCKTSDCFLVQVTVPYDDVALLPPFWIKGATVTGRAVMRHE